MADFPLGKSAILLTLEHQRKVLAYFPVTKFIRITGQKGKRQNKKRTKKALRLCIMGVTAFLSHKNELYLNCDLL